MTRNPRFAESPIPDGSALKLRSECLLCGDVRLVSVIDGSLEVAVRSEPLSGQFSLRTGNLTGNLELLALLHGWRRIACCTMRGA